MVEKDKAALRSRLTPDKIQPIHRLARAVEPVFSNDSPADVNVRRTKTVRIARLLDPMGHRQDRMPYNYSNSNSNTNSHQQRPGGATAVLPAQQNGKGQRAQNSEHKPSQSISRVNDRRSSMIASKPRETRRERHFIGSACAACEEPLEHKLHGERVLQLSCGHVSHEACFYEYIKDFDAQLCPSCDAPLALDGRRGGGIDFSNINKLIRSVQTSDYTRDSPRSTQTTPTPWDSERSTREVSPSQHRHVHSAFSREHLLPEHTHANVSFSSQANRLPVPHTRNRSGDTGAISSDDTDATRSNARRMESDVLSLDTTVSSTSRPSVKYPIPVPSIILRSEFPTLTKSRQSQSLTCLVTVEVLDGKWPPAEETHIAHTIPATIPEESDPSVPNSVSFQGAPTQRPVEPMNRDAAMLDDETLEAVKEDLQLRCENWHGLDFTRFGRLLLYGTVKVGKDRHTWQELDCYLFTEMLICVKPKKLSTHKSSRDHSMGPVKSKVSLKGSILIKRHLEQVEEIPDLDILTLSLSVTELPHFHLLFSESTQLKFWKVALRNLSRSQQSIATNPETEQIPPSADVDDYDTRAHTGRQQDHSIRSSTYGASRSQLTAHTDHSNFRAGHETRANISSLHVPLDIVVVIPVSSSMQGLKINLLRDSLRFLISTLGDRDRMALVSYGSGGGGIPIVGMSSKSWGGWPKTLEQLKPIVPKNMRADVVEGANVAMDLLMQRKTSNPISSILIISDSTSGDEDSVDFVISRAEAAKITIHTFGLGLTHKPDTLVELSTRTKASYTYVKDWMMLRECLGGCMGSLQSISHQNAKLKLRLPEGSPAKFVKISGALAITKRAAGRDAEASLGDLRFGDKRDILVQLAITPDHSNPDSAIADPWENIVSGLEALGPLEAEDNRAVSIEELPLIQVDLNWGDVLRDGILTQLPRPSLLAITMLPMPSKRLTIARPATPPIPPHPQIVQRRMELLTSDMLSRALTLVSRGQHDRARPLLAETRSILRGLGKGGLPPLPPPPPPTSALPQPPTPKLGELRTPTDSASIAESRRTPSPHRPEALGRVSPAAAIDPSIMTALDFELGAGVEWISHPAVFARDTRKAVLQAIGVISSQRAYTFRTPAESLWATRVSGIKRLAELNRAWREAGDDCLTEESG